jgi:bifunctional DNA-binding transcriptional regulator/antitoxin component of YhaV-PrlF toxin-antitoxin module
MPITFKRAVFKSGDSYRVTIPMEIVKALDIKEKEELKIWLDEPRIIIEKIKTKEL